MRVPVLTVAILALPALAQAEDPVAPAIGGTPPIESGEFRNTAQTTPKGAFLFHPLLMSQYGITDRLDIKAPILGSLLQGPIVAVEFQLVQTDAVALSIEPAAHVGWNPKNFGAGGMVRATMAVGTNRLNLSLGANYAQTFIRDTDLNTAGDQSLTASGVHVPINVGFDIVISDMTTLRAVINTEVPLNGAAFGAIGAFNWNHAFGEHFRLQLGVAIIGGGILDVPAAVTDQVDMPTWIVLPAPTFELWWRF